MTTKEYWEREAEKNRRADKEEQVAEVASVLLRLPLSIFVIVAVLATAVL